MDAFEDSRRLSVRAGDQETDVTVPAHLPVRELFPALLDAIGHPGVHGRDLRLARVCGDPIDPGTTLAHNDIGDGELLIVAPVLPPHPPSRRDTYATVTEAVDAATPPWRPTVQRTASWAVVGWAAAVLAVLLGRPVFDADAVRHPAVAGAAAAAALASAVVLHRRHHRVVEPTALGVLAAALAGLSALLTGPGLPGFVLAASAVASMALLAWRLLDCSPMLFLPMAGVAMAASAATTGALAGWWPMPAAGPALATGALIILGSAPRLAARSCGLGSTADSDTGLRYRALTAHRRASLLVATAGPATAAGAVISAATTSRPAEAAAFIAAVAATLLLRLAGHRDPYRAALLAVSSAAAVTSLMAMSVGASPHTTPWACGALVATAVTAGWLGGRDVARPSPAARRTVAVLDLALTAAVVPLAAAAAGLFPALPTAALP